MISNCTNSVWLSLRVDPTLLSSRHEAFPLADILQYRYYVTESEANSTAEYESNSKEYESNSKAEYESNKSESNSKAKSEANSTSKCFAKHEA